MYAELGKTDEEYICIIGDSFAGHRADSTVDVKSYDWSWVNLIEANNSGKLIGRSFPGQSFWHQRRWFTKNMIEWHSVRKTVLIFVHTQHHRLPHLTDIPITGQVLRADRSNPGQNELFKADPSGALFDLAAAFYSSGMFDQEFYRFGFISWLKEINEIAVNFKKVIHLFGFENGLSNLPNKEHRFYLEKLAQGNSTPVTTTLVSLTAAQRGSRTWGGPDLGPDVQNHLNKHNNIELAKFVQYLINEDKPGFPRHIPLGSFDIKDPTMIENIKVKRAGFNPYYEIPGAK